MLDIYVNITLEVMILDCGVLRTRPHLRINHECDWPLIILENCDWFLENTAQYLWGVSLNLKYKLYFLHKNSER